MNGRTKRSARTKKVSRMREECTQCVREHNKMYGICYITWLQIICTELNKYENSTVGELDLADSTYVGFTFKLIYIDKYLMPFSYQSRPTKSAHI